MCSEFCPSGAVCHLLKSQAQHHFLVNAPLDPTIHNGCSVHIQPSHCGQQTALKKHPSTCAPDSLTNRVLTSRRPQLNLGTSRHQNRWPKWWTSALRRGWNKSSKMPTIAFNSLRLRSIRCLNRKCWLRVLQLDFNTFWGWRYRYWWHRQLGWSQVCRWSPWRPKPTKQEEPKGKWDQWKHTILGCCLDKEFQGSNSESEFAVVLEH